MSITELLRKINIPLPADPVAGEVVSYDKDGEVDHHPLLRKLFLSFVIILVALLSFGIGRLTVIGKREPIRIEYDPELTTNDSQLTTKETINTNTASVINAVGNTEVITSKNGARYHYLHCSGAKQIKEENKIVFPTPKAAENAGYTLAANCKPE